MSAPSRLIDSGKSPMVRQLLAAGSTERAPHAVRTRALTRAAVVASSLGATHAAAGTAMSSTTLGAVGIAKALGSGLLVGTVVLSGTQLATRGSTDAKPAASPTFVARESRTTVHASRTPRAVASSPPSDPGVSPSVASSLPRDRTSEPDREAGRIHPSTPPAPEPAARSARSDEQRGPVDLETRHDGVSLTQEMRLVDEARQAVGEGRPAAALAALEQYRVVAPHGRFAPECEALRIEAHALRGERAVARALAAEFLRSHPASPLVERVRAQLDQQPGTSDARDGRGSSPTIGR